MTINHRRALTGAMSELARRKLEAFARIEKEFVASFTFVQEVHGQRRFTTFPVSDAVRYLHALYICECKDRLLSIPHTIHRYDGERSLELLRGWQEDRAASVVLFLHRRLDAQPFGDLTEQIEEATHAHDTQTARRLLSGRAVLLNRLFTLASAFDAIFALEPKQLRAEVRTSCKRFGHSREQIDRQLADLRSDLYAYAPSPALARHNMILMNRIGSHVMDADGDRPGERTDRVRRPALPVASYAEAAIPGAMTQISLRWNPRSPTLSRQQPGVPVIAG